MSPPVSRRPPSWAGSPTRTAPKSPPKSSSTKRDECVLRNRNYFDGIFNLGISKKVVPRDFRLFTSVE